MIKKYLVNGIEWERYPSVLAGGPGWFYTAYIPEKKAIVYILYNRETKLWSVKAAYDPNPKTDNTYQVLGSGFKTHNLAMQSVNKEKDVKRGGENANTVLSNLQKGGTPDGGA